MSKLFDRTKRRSVYLGDCIRVGVLMLAVFMSVMFNFSTSYASAASLTIKYDGKKQTYTGAQTKVTYEGAEISLGDVPGIIIDNTCMVPFREVFVNGLGVAYAYDSTTGTIALEQNGIIINMTVGSKTAYVNGVKKTLDIAPKKIKFYSVNKTKVYVPARFVAESLGYGYTWNNSERVSQIVPPLKIKYDEFATEWVMYTGVKGNVVYNGNDVDVSDMPCISLDDTILIRAEKVFSETIGVDYSYDSTSQTITLKRNDVTVSMSINSNIAIVNGMPYEMDTAARMVTAQKTGNSYVMIPAAFTAETLGYGYSWNENTQTVILTRVESNYTSLTWQEDLLMSSYYSAMVTDITVSHKKNLDILSITGTSPLIVNVNEERTGMDLQIEVCNVYNQIDYINKTFTDGIFINGITVTPSSNGITINLDKNTNCSFYTSQSGNTFQIVFCENITTDVANSMYQMKFVLPSGVGISSITDEDRYYENTFILTIPGDYIEYFSANPILYNPTVIERITLSLSDTGNTEIKVVTHKLQGYRLNDCGDYIGVNVANPSYIYKNIVVLDAGHGGKDVGALNSSIYEKELNLSIIYGEAKQYFDSSDSEIKAYWTRIDDTYVSLADRAAFATEVEADLFVSLHMNSATSKTANGLEVLYAATNSYVMSELDSKTMADIFREQLMADLDMKDRGVKNRSNLVVLKSNNVPAVLIELGFISNTSDFKKLSDPEFQQAAAASIYEATKACFELYPTGR